MHDPLLATKKMLEQGVITQIEYDEIAGTIMAGQMLYDSDKKPQRTPSSSAAEAAIKHLQRMAMSTQKEKTPKHSPNTQKFYGGMPTLISLPQSELKLKITKITRVANRSPAN